MLPTVVIGANMDVTLSMNGCILMDHSLRLTLKNPRHPWGVGVSIQKSTKLEQSGPEGFLSGGY